MSSSRRSGSDRGRGSKGGVGRGKGTTGRSRKQASRAVVSKSGKGAKKSAAINGGGGGGEDHDGDDDVIDEDELEDLLVGLHKLEKDPFYEKEIDVEVQVGLTGIMRNEVMWMDGS